MKISRYKLKFFSRLIIIFVSHFFSKENGNCHCPECVLRHISENKRKQTTLSDEKQEIH